jgi:hypothetical protein
MSLNHDLPSAAHQGVTRTKAKVKEKFYWHRLSEDVKDFLIKSLQCVQSE